MEKDVPDREARKSSRRLAASRTPPPSVGMWLDPEQVMTFLNISPSTLHRLVRDGEFPKPVKIGRGRRWRESAVADYLKSLESAGSHG